MIYGTGQKRPLLYYPLLAMQQALKLEGLKCSSDLLNNVKIGQGQFRLIIQHILFYHI